MEDEAANPRGGKLSLEMEIVIKKGKNKAARLITFNIT
jgi:hypothetical protein